MTFQDALYGQLQQLPTWCDWHGHLARKIEAATPGVQDASVALVEQCVRAGMGIDPTCPVDWASGTPGGKAAINWANLLAFIQTLLPIIMSIIGGLTPKPA